MFADTIVAIATPLQPSGLGVIRVSGSTAIASVGSIFQPSHGGTVAESPNRKLRHGWLNIEGQLVDEAMLVVMRGPHSFTAEDVVELQCHGSPQMLQMVLQQILMLGTRLAEPGEFTRRAFLNGRLDLTRVEAIADLIHADSRMSVLLAAQQLRGRLYETIQQLQEELIQIASLIEAWIEFPDEDEEFTGQTDCERRLQSLCSKLEELLQKGRQGRLLRNGVHVVLCGRPNVGKSSLMNALLRENRSIVTEIPGTTRDIIEESLEIHQVAFRLSDTAGIRRTEDLVEKQGVERTKKAIEQADLVLLLLDGSQELQAEDQELFAEVEDKPLLIVATKADLWDQELPKWKNDIQSRWIPFSVHQAETLEELEEALYHNSISEDVPSLEESWLTNLRQQAAAEKASESLKIAQNLLQQRTGEEFVAAELRRALNALGEIVGQTTADDLLSRVFAEFCIGK
ncbi:MAG: tRNA uridine-5-carboxymethylaminomethyl(34) synthesis GTPase MnmE [Deltaproteobacteria bacterium]